MGHIHKQMVEETRRRIENTFIELIGEHGFEHVTVKQIADKAGVNRGTFYRHYTDKYALMSTVQENMLTLFKQRVRQIRPEGILESLRTKQLYPPFLQIFYFIEEYASVLHIILGENGDPRFNKQIKDVIRDIMETYLLADVPTKHNPLFKQYIVAFLTSAILGLIQEWLEQLHTGEKQSAKDFAEVHFEIISFMSNLKERLERLQAD